MTEQDIIDAGIDYTMEHIPVCIAGDAFYEQARQLNRNRNVEAEEENGNWELITNPEWNWGLCNYRVKEESKYRPCDSAEAFIQASEEHGIWLRHKDSKDYLLLHEVDSTTLKVRIYKFEYTFEQLLKYYT